MYFLFIFVLSFLISPSLQCHNFFCKVCNFSFYDETYEEKLSLSFSIEPSSLMAQCLPKNATNIIRKVFIQNSLNHVIQNQIGYDHVYTSFAQAIQNESRILFKYLTSSLYIILEAGDHFIKYSDFENEYEEIFRRILVNITISSIFPDTSRIFIKTNKFYLFVSSYFSINDIIFLGNDINWRSYDEICYKTNELCCQDSDFGTNYASAPSSNKSQCFIKNYPINKLEKVNYYGMFNLEYIADNLLRIQPNLTIKNCQFLNFFLLDSDGFSSLISFAPLSGVLIFDSVILKNTLFPQGLIYYSKVEFDLLYLSFSRESLPESYFMSFIETILIRNIKAVAYNPFPLINDFELYILIASDFQGNIIIQNSLFDTILNITALFKTSNQGISNYFEITNFSVRNLYQSSFLKATTSQNLTIKNLTFSTYESVGIQIFILENLKSVLLYSINFTNFKLDSSTNCFQIRNSFLSINNSFFIKGQFNSLIQQEKQDLFIGNTTFSELTFKDNLITFSGLNGVIIENSFFSKIQGSIYFFVLLKGHHFILYSSILEYINTYAFFYLVESNLNLNERIVLRNSYFYYIWEKDTTCKSVITNYSEIYNNTVAISFYRDLSIPNILFLLTNVYIAANDFIQLNSGGMIQMQVGDCTFYKTHFIDNYFLNYNRFQYLFEFDEYCHLVVRDCFFKDNGIITKKELYFTYTDNDIFCLWSVVYTHFNNTIMMITDKIEMLAGFISAAPHGGIFEFLNCILIFEIKNTIFEYKGIQLDHFISATFINNTFYNLKCNRKTFANKYGGISLLASTSYIFSRGQNNFWVYIKNNSFYNCTCVNGGGLSIVGIKDITILDCKFYQSRTENQGGALILVGSENCLLKNIYINGSQAFEGGGLYVQNIFSLNVDNITLMNVYAEENAIFFIKNIGLLNLKNLITENTTVGKKGGVFLIIKSVLLLSTAVISNSKAHIEGGTLVCDDRSQIILNDLSIENSSSAKAGVFSVIGTINFNLYNCLIQNSFSTFDGGVFLLKIFTRSTLENLTLVNSNSLNGLGVILIQNDDDDSQINIKNLNCINVSAIDGSCILFFASSKMSLENIKIENSGNNPLSFVGLITVSINLQNLTIIHSHSSKNIIYLSNIVFSSIGLKIFDNYATSDIISANYVVCRISQAIFLNNSKFRVFLILKSSIFFDQVELNGQNNEVLYMNSFRSNITMNFTFFFGGSTTTEKGLLFFSNSNFVSSDCYFLDNKGLVLQFFNSFLITITNCIFHNNTISNHYDANDIFTENEGGFFTQLYIKKSKFEIFDGLSNFYSGNLNSIINESFFINMIKENSNRGIYVLHNAKLSIIQTSFLNFTESAVKILNEVELKKTEILIIESIFAHNKGSKGSSIYLEGDIIVKIINCSFLNNTALLSNKNTNILEGVAPCVYFKPKSIGSSHIEIRSSFFQENKAEFLASTVFSQNSITYDNNSVFIKNKDMMNFSDKFFSLPIQIKLSKTLSEEFEKTYLEKKEDNFTILFCSGIPFRLEFILQDNFNQTLVFDNQSVIFIKNKDMNSSFAIENGFNRSIKGKVTFEHLLLKYKPNTSFILSISGIFQGISKEILYQEFYQEIIFRARECQIGEIILNDHSCVKCPSNTYSFQDPMTLEPKYHKCHKCPPFSECPGGKQITPLQGYYRNSNTSTNVVACLSAEACLGNKNRTYCDSDCMENINIHGACEIGNTGLLCSDCIEFYGKYDKFEPCKVCASLQTLVICRLVGYITLMCIYVFLTSHFAEKHNVEKNEYSQIGVFSKIIINHSQQINIILLNGVNLPFFDFTKLFTVTDYMSFTNDQVLNNDCLFQHLFINNGSAGMMKIIFNSILPVFFSMLSFTLWISYSLFFQRIKKLKKNTKRSYFLSKLLMFSVLSIFMFYPLIIKSSFEMFDCMKLDPNSHIKFLKVNLELVCWTKTHIGFIFIVAFPGLLVWGIGFPLFLSDGNSKSRKNRSK